MRRNHRPLKMTVSVAPGRTTTTRSTAAEPRRTTYRPPRLGLGRVTIMRNHFYSEIRKRRREVEDADGAFASRLADAPRQDGHLDMADFLRALHLVPDEQRGALILVGASGFSYEEAAVICGVRLGTIKSRVSRARVRLQELLTGSEPLPPANSASDSGRLDLPVSAHQGRAGAERIGRRTASGS